MDRRRSSSGWAVLLGLTVLAAGCGGGSTSPAGPGSATTTSAVDTTAAPPGVGAASPCGTRASPPARYDHVVWIWMENHTYDQVIGNAAAPYETKLARRCGTATAYASVASPSLPNYIGATSGGTQGVSDDRGPDVHKLTADNLFRQVRSSGGAARSYQESMPADCAVDPAGTYAVKHNPAAYYQGGSDRSACQADDVPMGGLTDGALASDLDHGTLATFSFVTPDLCHDTHDCPVRRGDDWLKDWLPRILTSRAYTSGTTAVMLMWDEYTPMPNVVISPTTRPGTAVADKLDHYSLLRTTEELLGLPAYLGKAASAPSMRAAFGL